MVHISDGVLSPPVLAAGFALAGLLLFVTLRDVRAEEIPKISLITAAVFVASLVHFPVGPTSVHLVMNGLAGILLGKRAFVSVAVALTLQAVLFQHGGISASGSTPSTWGFRPSSPEDLRLCTGAFVGPKSGRCCADGILG